MITARETVDRAQESVDQLQRGLSVVAGRLESLEEAAATADAIVATTRRWVKPMLVVWGILMAGSLTAIVVVGMRRRRSRRTEDDE